MNLKSFKGNLNRKKSSRLEIGNVKLDRLSAKEHYLFIRKVRIFAARQFIYSIIR